MDSQDKILNLLQNLDTTMANFINTIQDKNIKNLFVPIAEEIKFKLERKKKSVAQENILLAILPFEDLTNNIKKLNNGLDAEITLQNEIYSTEKPIFINDLLIKFDAVLGEANTQNKTNANSIAIDYISNAIREKILVPVDDAIDGLIDKSIDVYSFYKHIYHSNFIIVNPDFSNYFISIYNFLKFKLTKSNESYQEIYNSYAGIIKDIKNLNNWLTPEKIISFKNENLYAQFKSKNNQTLYALLYPIVIAEQYCKTLDYSTKFLLYIYTDSNNVKNYILYIIGSSSQDIYDADKENEELQSLLENLQDVMPLVTAEKYDPQKKKMKNDKTPSSTTTEKKIEEGELNIEYPIIFPRLNKNNDIKDNILSCMENGFFLERVIVKKTITVDNEKWIYLTRDFYEEHPEWEQIGGNEKINDTDYLQVVKLINSETGEAIYIDTEGYNYARYVGHKSADYKKHEAILKPLIDAKIQKEKEAQNKKDAPKNFYSQEVTKQKNCQEQNQTKRILKSNPLYKKIMANITAIELNKQGYDGMIDSSTYWSEYLMEKDEIQKIKDLINQNNLKIDYKGNGIYNIWLSRLMRRKFNHLTSINFVSICLNSQQTSQLPAPDDIQPPEEESSDTPPDEFSDDSSPQIDSQGNVLQDCYLFDNLGRLELYLTKNTYNSLTNDQKQYLKKYFLNSPRGARISKSKDGINFKNRVRSILGDKFPDNVECTSLPQDLSAFKWKKKWIAPSAQGINAIYLDNNYIIIKFNFSDYIKIKNKPEFATAKKLFYILFEWDKQNKFWKSKNTVNISTIDNRIITIGKTLKTLIPNIVIAQEISHLF